jgi:broad specificity phosphatase PhoE
LSIHLIRHAHAGSRKRWEGPDEGRPLSERGRAQAGLLDLDLADASIEVLVSSRFVRCIQTLEPLAERLGLTVATSLELTEGGAGAAALDELLRVAGGGRTVAACSHGDVIPALLATATGRGASLDGPVSPAKGARYELQVADGRVTSIVHVPAPEGRD